MKRAEIYDKVKELAEERGLEFAEVTSGRNGYPQGLRPAIVGFESLSEYTAFVKEVQKLVHEWSYEEVDVEMDEVVLRKRDGWSLYEFVGSAPLDGLSSIQEDDIWADDNGVRLDCNGNIVERANGLTSYSEDVWHYEMGAVFSLFNK